MHCHPRLSSQPVGYKALHDENEDDDGSENLCEAQCVSSRVLTRQFTTTASHETHKAAFKAALAYEKQTGFGITEKDLKNDIDTIEKK